MDIFILQDFKAMRKIKFQSEQLNQPMNYVRQNLGAFLEVENMGRGAGTAATVLGSSLLRFGQKKLYDLDFILYLDFNVWDSQNFVLKLHVIESKLHHVQKKLHYVQNARNLQPFMSHETYQNELICNCYMVVSYEKAAYFLFLFPWIPKIFVPLGK